VEKQRPTVKGSKAFLDVHGGVNWQNKKKNKKEPNNQKKRKDN
jgi:hypothetical protein